MTISTKGKPNKSADSRFAEARATPFRREKKDDGRFAEAGATPFQIKMMADCVPSNGQQRIK
jgi:hypothetical protein